MHRMPVATPTSTAVRFQEAYTSSVDSPTITTNGKSPTREKVYSRSLRSRLETAVKVPCSASRKRWKFAEAAKFCPTTALLSGWRANRSPLVFIRLTKLSLPISSLLNRSSK
ncbi:hypothetical protein D3C81_1685760 [compost metagenome]